MSVEAALLRGRAAAELLMVDECVIRRRTGQTTDPDTGEVTDETDELYAGKCRIQQTEALGIAADVGEDAMVRMRHVLQVPMTVIGVQVGDEVEVTDSALDEDLVGRTWLVRGLGHKTHMTSRRLQLEERE